MVIPGVAWAIAGAVCGAMQAGRAAFGIGSAYNSGNNGNMPCKIRIGNGKYQRRAARNMRILRAPSVLGDAGLMAYEAGVCGHVRQGFMGVRGRILWAREAGIL